MHHRPWSDHVPPQALTDERVDTAMPDQRLRSGPLPCGSVLAAALDKPIVEPAQRNHRLLQLGGQETGRRRAE